MNVIKVRNLYTSFDKNVIHNNISFDIKKNEIFGILGGSGSGKTVLIKQIVMLQKIQKGEIIFLNENLSNLTLKKKKI